MTESEEQKNAGEKLTMEDAVSLVNGYANLCEIWVREARRGDSLWDRGKDRSVIYLEKLGAMVGELWELWNRTTHRYPILRPVVRSMGANVLDNLQNAVVSDDTLDDDWDIQKVICWTRSNMEERMNLPPWRECLYGEEGERCRHSNDYEDDAAEWECCHCHDRHADEAEEAETQTENPPEPTEEEPSEVPAEHQTEEAVNMCIYCPDMVCPHVKGHLDHDACEAARISPPQCAYDPSVECTTEVCEKCGHYPSGKAERRAPRLDDLYWCVWGGAIRCYRCGNRPCKECKHWELAGEYSKRFIEDSVKCVSKQEKKVPAEHQTENDYILYIPPGRRCAFVADVECVKGVCFECEHFPSDQDHLEAQTHPSEALRRAYDSVPNWCVNMGGFIRCLHVGATCEGCEHWEKAETWFNEHGFKTDTERRKENEKSCTN